MMDTIPRPLHFNAKDLTGYRAGKLLVKAPVWSKTNRPAWLCSCDCGTETIVLTSNLTRENHTTSCGCVFKDMHASRLRKADGVSSLNSMFHYYSRNARKKGRVWEINKEDFAKLTSTECFYCDRPPIQRFRRKNLSGNYATVYLNNGLDRIDSTRGYTLDNVVPCCGQCNFGKGRLSVDDFLEWVADIHERRDSIKEKVN